MIDYHSFIKDIWKAGGEAYLVGGWVRDKLLNRISNDIDIEVIGIPRSKFEKIMEDYGRYYRCGKAYEIYILSHSVEISYIEERLPIKDLAKRRDFTLNSLYYNPLTDKITDLYDGQRDIADKIIRHTAEDVFSEDPLRIIRAIELSSRLDFEISKKTMLCMKMEVSSLEGIPLERIVDELRKIYLTNIKPSRAFISMDNIGVFKYILPRLHSLKKVIQDEIYHPEGDVFTHILMMLDVLPIENRSMEVFWAIIYHDTGKELTYPEFKGHALVSKDIFVSEGRKLVQDKKLQKKIESLIEYHEEPLSFLIEGFDNIRLRKLAVKVDIPKLLDLYLCDVLGRGRKNNDEELQIIEKIKILYKEIQNELTPLISGKDLLKWKLFNVKDFSKILSLLYEAQLEEKFVDKDGAKAFFFSKLKND